MTRKDYELIARALYEAKPTEALDVGWRRCVGSMTYALGTTNPRFDSGKFLQYCEKGHY